MLPSNGPRVLPMLPEQCSTEKAEAMGATRSLKAKETSPDRSSDLKAKQLQCNQEEHPKNRQKKKKKKKNQTSQAPHSPATLISSLHW